MPPHIQSTAMRSAALTLCLFGLAGCDHFDIRDAASHLPPYQNAVDQPKNVIDAALDQCPDKTAEQEGTCVKRALTDKDVALAALVALVPGCQAGHVCVYHHTSEDRLGYVPAIAEDFVARWKVSFDLGKSAKRAGDVPVTVEVD